MIYWMYHKHHFLPSDIAKRGPEEKKILQAFFEYEIEEENKEAAEIKRQIAGMG